MTLTITDKVSKFPSSLLFKDIPTKSLFRWASDEFSKSSGTHHVGYKTSNGGFIFFTDSSPEYYAGKYEANKEVVLLEGELIITKEL